MESALGVGQEVKEKKAEVGETVESGRVFVVGGANVFGGGAGSIGEDLRTD